MQRRNFLGAPGRWRERGARKWVSPRAPTTAATIRLVCVFLAGGKTPTTRWCRSIRRDMQLRASARRSGAAAGGSCRCEAGGVLRYGFHPRFPGCKACGRPAILQLLPMSAPWCSRSPRRNICRAPRRSRRPCFAYRPAARMAIGESSTASSTGWGGRLTDQLTALNADATVPR